MVRSHFGLNAHFEVVFCDRKSRSKRSVNSPNAGHQLVYSGNSYFMEFQKDRVSDKDRESVLKTVLSVFMDDDVDGNVTEKKEKLMQYMDDINSGKIQISDFESHAGVNGEDPQYDQGQVGNVRNMRSVQSGPLLEMTTVSR